MKERILSLFLILTFIISLLTSCGDSEIEEKEFVHCEMTLVLDDSFEAEESENFDLIISNGDIAISLIRISFEAGYGQGISDTFTAKGFAAFFLYNSGKDAELSEHGSVPYYVYSEKSENGGEVSYTVTFYRSLNAYFVVTYAVSKEDYESHSDKIFEYSSKVYFNDAPTVD